MFMEPLPGAPTFWQALSPDPSAIGRLWDGLELPPLEEQEGDTTEEPQDRPRGEPHNAHVIAFQARWERCRHLADLTRGLLRIHRHLDGSPGSTRMGFSEDWCHGTHRWADEADLLAWAEATPFKPADNPPFPAAKGYPSCSLPWYGWPPLLGRDKPHLVMLRVWRGEAEVRAQIAAAGGLDDDRGWITRPAMPDLARFDDWRRRIFMTPAELAEELAAQAKTRRRERKTTDQREQRAEERAKKREAAAPPPARSARPVVIDGDFAFVPLTKGYTARIAAADAHLVEGHDWHVVTNPGRQPFARRHLPGAGARKTALRMNKVEGLTGPVVILPPPG